MSTFSPVVADAIRMLQMNLYEHLDEAEFLATKYDDWTEKDAETGRELIPDLVAVIRGLLIHHQVQPGTDTCPTCSSSWPCPVITRLHALIKDPDRAFIALLDRAERAQYGDISG